MIKSSFTKNGTNVEAKKDEFKDVEAKDNKFDSSMNVGIFSKYNYNREIYANTESYAVVEPGSIGAYMIRSITQVISNDDLFKKDFDTIMNHTRKTMSKLMGTTVECGAQVIEDNNNIPRKIFFHSQFEL